MICVSENRLIDAEWTKAIFYFFKVIYFYIKKLLKLARKYKLAKLANKLKYKIDFGIWTEHLIAIAYE